jgi:hypothetical protein
MKPNNETGASFVGMYGMIAVYAKVVKSFTVKSDHKKKLVFGLKEQMI